MSSIDWVPELAARLDALVPLEDSPRADWGDVVARTGRRRQLRLWRTFPRRRLRLAIVVALLFLLLTGAATATYLLLRANGDIAVPGRGKLLVFNPNGQRLHAIASCPAHSPSCAIGSPAWSPAGTRVAFLRGFYGGGNAPSHLFLYVAAADGRGMRRLAACGSCGTQWGEQHIAWSPDGRWIAFTRDTGTRRRRQEALWVDSAAGGRLHRLTYCHPSCADVQPAWSPDGHLLAFLHLAPTSSVWHLYTVHSDGSGLTEIADGAEPQWSPDGRRIAFDLRKGGIEVADADGSHVHLLIAGKSPGAPSWSPNGRKLVFFNAPGWPGHYRAEVWTMNADGSHKKRLYRSGCCVDSWAPPIWSPDGRMIAFSANSARGTFVINAEGTGLRRLSSIVTDSLSWQAQPKGKQR
ncbi:MAG TPA: hypothetical protein VGH46_02345 [Gaiellaceae bacterium]